MLGRIMKFLDLNIDELFRNFMAQRPDYHQLLFIHRWYDLSCKVAEEAGRQHPISQEAVKDINLRKFRIALNNIVETRCS